MQTYCAEFIAKGGEKVEQLYIGIDVGSKKNAVFLMKPDGEKHSSFTVANNPEGAAKIIDSVVNAAEHLHVCSIRIGIEATSIYGNMLLYTLKESAKLKALHYDIYQLNPKQVSKFKGLYNDLQKNDYIDSFVIADRLRFGRFSQGAFNPDYRYSALQMLTRARFHAVKNLAREKQHFANYLYLKCCALAQEKPVSTNNNGFLAVMEKYSSVDELANANIEEIATLIREASQNHNHNPEALAIALKNAARASYHLPQTVSNSVHQAMAVTIASIRACESQIKTLEKAIEQQLAVIPNTIGSIPGIGKVYSAGIIAEIGDIKRFKNNAALAKYAGLVWSQHQSGEFEGQSTHLIKSGNHFLRYYLLEAANSVKRYVPEYRTFYERKFIEVNKFQHKRALALTARKLVRLIFRLQKDNRLYT